MGLRAQIIKMVFLFSLALVPSVSVAATCTFAMHQKKALRADRLSIGDEVQLAGLENDQRMSATFIGEKQENYEFISDHKGFFSIPKESISLYEGLNVEKQKWINLQVGGTCAANATLNCAQMVFAADSMLKEPSTLLIKHDAELLAKAIEALHADIDYEHLFTKVEWKKYVESLDQKKLMLNYFHSVGLRAEGTRKWQSLMLHLQGGNPLVWVSYMKDEYQDYSINPTDLIADGGQTRRYARFPHSQRVIQGILNKSTRHAVVVVGLIRTPQGTPWALVFDSNFRELQFWKVSEMEQALKHGSYAILVSPKLLNE